MSNNPSEISQIWSHTRVYGLGTVINRAAGIILIPFYTHLLPDSEFGLYAIVVVAGELAGILLSRGFSTAMVRIYLNSESEDYRAEVITTALIGFTGLALVVAMLVPSAAHLSSRLFFQTTEHQLLFELAFYSNIVSMIFNITLDYFRVSKKPWTFLWIATAKSLLMFAINITLVAYYQM